MQGLREKRYSPLTWGDHFGCESYWVDCNKHILGARIASSCVALRKTGLRRKLWLMFPKLLLRAHVVPSLPADIAVGHAAGAPPSVALPVH